MRSPYAASLRQRELDLQETAQALRELDEGAPEGVERALARYLAVRSAGFLEATRDDLADEYARVTAQPRVHRRVASHLRGGLGVSPGQLLDFVGTFDLDWRADLEGVLNADDARLKDELGAMVAARKKIAHGDGDTVTAARALRWADAALTIAANLKRIFSTS